MSVNDIAAKVYPTSGSVGHGSSSPPSYSGPEEVIAVDPELVRPVEVVLPPVEPAIAGDAQPTLDAWGSSNGYVFEW